MTRPALGDRAALRAELGYGDDERVCIVSVGGSGVGSELLRRVIESFPEAKRLVPGLRMIVVAGPRIEPGSLPGGCEVWRSVSTSATCTAIWPPAMWPSCRAD